jgi:hypothetical protein
MRRAALVPVLAVLGLVGPACAPNTPPQSLTIVADPGPFQSLEEAANAEARVEWRDSDPTDDDGCVAGFAALELRRWLPEVLTPTRESIALSASMPAGGDVVVLRQSPASGSPHSRFRIHLERSGRRRVVTIEGGDRTGLLYGTYALLETLGLRFQALGDSGVTRPRAPSPWPERLDVEESSSFVTRGFWVWEPRGHPEFFLWMARNRLNLWTAADTAYVPLMKKLGLRLSGGGHTLQRDFLAPARFFTTHPEYFGLHDGRRSPRLEGDGGDNFCTSNPAARLALAEQVVEGLISGSLRNVDVLELWMLDQGRWCECRACLAQGEPGRRWWAVTSDVVTAIDAARRDGRLERPVEVSTPAYLETLTPAQSARDSAGVSRAVTFFPYFRCYAHALGDTTCGEINRRLARALGDWTARREGGVALGVCEYFNVAAFKSLPVLFPHVMAADFAAYRRAGVSRIQFMHVPTASWGSWTLQLALFAALTWNPGADVDSLMNDFCRRAYPARAEKMRIFYSQLAEATANVLALQHVAGVYAAGAPGGRLSEARFPVFPLRHLRESPAPDTLDRAASLDEIDQAMAAARRSLDEAAAGMSGDERIRIAEVEGRFAYGEATFALYSSLIRTALAHRARDGDAARRSFTVAEDAVRRLGRVADLVQVASSHANAADGLEASGVRPTFEYFARLYGR